MKTIKTISIALALVLFSGSAVKAQFNFFNAGIEDGMELFNAYATPWVKAFGTDLNGGWYNSAVPHNLGGFDITFTSSVTMIPEADRTMDLSKLTFNNLTVDPSGSTIAPTVAGSNKSGPDLTYIDNSTGTDVEITSFSSPQGSGLHYFPAPMIQAGVGLPKSTEIVLRYFPMMKIPSTNAKVGLWGVGLKHSVLQYFKKLDKLPMDVSVFAGYTSLSTTVAISVQPKDVLPSEYSENVNLVEYDLSDFQKQSVDVKTSGYNLSLIASTTLPVINVYGSLGYSNANTTVDILGPIPIPSLNIDDPLDPQPEVVDEGVQEIPGFEIENRSG